jgi:hypothetical protein
MDTTPADPHELESWLAARGQALLPEERQALDARLAAEPALAAETRALERFLDTLRAARIEAGPAHRVRVRNHLASLDRSPVPTASEPDSLLRRLWRLVTGSGEAQVHASRSTRLLGRSLAVYLGVAACLGLWLLIRQPAPDGGLPADGLSVQEEPAAASQPQPTRPR